VPRSPCPARRAPLSRCAPTPPSYIRGSSRALGAEGLRRLRSKLARLIGRLRVHTTVVVELIQMWRRRNDASKPTEEADASVKPSAAGAPEQPAAPGPPPPARVALSREADGEVFYWLGWNYLLKMGTDLAHLPIPSYTDPLLLNWWHYEAPDVERDEALKAAPYSLGLEAKFDAKLQADGGLQSPEEQARQANMREAAVSAEAEWWYDAARLHNADDLDRMTLAQRAILAESSRHSPPSKLRVPLDEQAPPEPMPLSDLGRELEVILYGGLGGFAAKLKSMRVLANSSRVLQCMMRLNFFKRRVARRVVERNDKAARVVQKRWRNRAAANLSGLSDLFANLALASQKDFKLSEQQKEEGEKRAKEREEAAARRQGVLRRRWAALRSCFKELRQMMDAALKVQCLYRSNRARRIFKLRQRDKKMQLCACC
jgi:hypothetical protein